jgi:hypothetical protein
MTIEKLAVLIAEDLIEAGLLRGEDLDQAIEVIGEQLAAREALKDIQIEAEKGR